ncbi:hypothetical protein EsH8_XII_000046 [Colletotrichum jinshuiense]
MPSPFRPSLQGNPLVAVQSIILFNTSYRLELLERYRNGNADDQQTYATALNDVAGKDLLPEETEFLARFNQDRIGTHEGRDHVPPGTPSTTLTDMDLERRERQRPSHSRKIVNLYQEETRAGHVMGRKTRRGTRGGESRKIMAPLSPPEAMPDRLALASDVSDMVSNASTGFHDRLPSQYRTRSEESLHHHGVVPLSPPEPTSDRLAAAADVSDMTSSDHPPPRPYHPLRMATRTQLEGLTEKLREAQSKYRTHAQSMVDLDAEMRAISADMLRLACEDKGLNA